MKKILKKITSISVICSMIFAMVAFPVGAVNFKLTFELDGGNIDGTTTAYTCETQTINGNEYIKSEDLEKVYGATKEGHILCFNGYADANNAKYYKEDLRRLNITGDMTFTAQWTKPILVRLLGIDPRNASSVCSLNHESGYCITDDDIPAIAKDMYPKEAEQFLSEYRLVRVEYADSSTTATSKYIFGTPIDKPTDLQLIWEKNDTSGGGSGDQGGSSGGGSGDQGGSSGGGSGDQGGSSGGGSGDQGGSSGGGSGDQGGSSGGGSGDQGGSSGGGSGDQGGSSGGGSGDQGGGGDQGDSSGGGSGDQGDSSGGGSGDQGGSSGGGSGDQGGGGDQGDSSGGGSGDQGDSSGGGSGDQGGSSGGGGGSSGGGGGSSGGGGRVSNPKTGDLGIATYVGILTISVLGTAGVVKLLKKEK